MLYQVPEGSVVPTASPASQPLFDFPSVSDLIIPRQEFCDRLVTVCTNHYRVIGHPVCIEHARYDRNQFIFILCVVLDEDADFTGHRSVVKKLAGLLRNLEEQSAFLSKDESDLRTSNGAKPDEALGSPLQQPVADLDGGYASLSNSIELNGESSQATKMYALCEIILEDLNNYCECMIPIGTSKLAPRDFIPV